MGWVWYKGWMGTTKHLLKWQNLSCPWCCMWVDRLVGLMFSVVVITIQVMQVAAHQRFWKTKPSCKHNPSVQMPGRGTQHTPMETIPLQFRQHDKPQFRYWLASGNYSDTEICCKYVTCEETCFKMTAVECVEMAELQSTQEEADTSLPLHAIKKVACIPCCKNWLKYSHNHSQPHTPMPCCCVLLFKRISPVPVTWANWVGDRETASVTA